MLVVAPEIQSALARDEPVVALESTLIAHGIPRPRNLELAHALENEVRERGAIPATVGIVDGAARVGLSGDQLSQLAENPQVVKCSTRDLARVIAAGQPGATTIASTIYLARRAGLRIMATGGLGGVHPGGELTMDVSADLCELARSPMAVFCSGPKIILDLPRTMEVLETQGVAIVGHGCERLPGFYLAETDIAVPGLASVAQVAGMLMAHDAIGWPGSIVIANPPPREQAFQPEEFAELLAGAQQAAAAAGIRGGALTPYLLAEIAARSGQRSVALNEALVLSNAALAAEVACAVAAAGR